MTDLCLPAKPDGLRTEPQRNENGNFRRGMALFLAATFTPEPAHFPACAVLVY